MNSICTLLAAGASLQRVALYAISLWAATAGATLLKDATVLAPFGNSTAVRPPEVPHDGVNVLKPVDPSACKLSEGPKSNTSSDAKDALSLSSNQQHKATREQLKRKAFVCTAGCGAREPQLEESLAPWADWSQNSSGLEMLAALEGFCTKHANADSPFILTVLWQGDVYVKACQRDNLEDGSFYLIGPEDLSLVLIFLLTAQRIAPLPDGPIAFGMYLSDYTSLLDRHLVGPGLPIFAYLGRATSWLIPWPSSFTILSAKDVEEWEQQRSQSLALATMHTQEDKVEAPIAPKQKLWKEREAQAYWIGAVTGPWQFALDADLLAIPRLKLLKMAKEHPKQIRAEWSSTASYGISWVKDAKNVSGFLAPRSRSVTELTGAPQSDYKETNSWDGFKYYVNLDGVVLGGRMTKLLSLGGVVLQHQAGYVEHIDALMKPYEHYVPIEYDLSDLVAKVQWLQNNDAEAKRIAENGRKLAAQRMRLEDHLCYVWRALEGLGSKTAQVHADHREVSSKLKGYRRVTVKEDGEMRSTLEDFWGDKLEKVSTGMRTISKPGIEMLEWTWKRFEKLYTKAETYK